MDGMYGKRLVFNRVSFIADSATHTDTNKTIEYQP